MNTYQISEESYKKGYEAGVKDFAERLTALFEQYATYDTMHIYEIKDRIDIMEQELTEGKEDEGK